MSTNFTKMVTLEVSRTRAFTRGVLWLILSTLVGAATLWIFQGLNFSPTGVSNRLVEYSIAIFALPLPLGALWTLIKSLRWLLLSAWPGQLGVFADQQELTLALGPFGIHKYDIPRMDIRYPFELSADLEGEGYEAFLPEEEQKEKFLPRLNHPLAKGKINQTILAYVYEEEIAVASVMRPMIELWRTAKGLE